MSNLEELKARAEFFPKGHIVPRRINAVYPRKYQHRLRFGADSWAIAGIDGYVVIQQHETARGESCLRFQISQKQIDDPRIIIRIEGSPYHDGATHFFGGLGKTEEEHCAAIIRHLKP